MILNWVCRPKKSLQSNGGWQKWILAERKINHYMRKLTQKNQKGKQKKFTAFYVFGGFQILRNKSIKFFFFCGYI